MIRYLQNEADANRSLTWRRRRRVQGPVARMTPRTPDPAMPADVASPVADATETVNQTSPQTKLRRTPLGNGLVQLVTVRLVERIASGTDPLKDLAIVQAVDWRAGKPTGPRTVMLLVDLAARIAEGSIRLDHGDPHHRRVTRGWEAPLFFGEMRRILIDRIRAARESGEVSPDELVCTMARAMGVANNDAANVRFIDAVWTSPDAILGDRPTARSLTRLRAAFRRRDAAPTPKPPHTAGGSTA